MYLNAIITINLNLCNLGPVQQKKKKRPHFSHTTYQCFKKCQPTILCSKLTTETLEQGVNSKLTLKTPKQHHWRRSGFFIVNFEHNSHLVLVFLLLTLSR